MSEENETIREKFMRDRAADYMTKPMGFLMEKATEYGVAYSDNTSVRDLARWLAGAKWERRSGVSDADLQAKVDAAFGRKAGAQGEESPYTMEAVGEEAKPQEAGLYTEAQRGENPFGIATSSGWFIYEVVLPEVLQRFFRKNADYNDNHRTGLGIKAEFVGLHRKIEKLEAAVWRDQPMQGESTEEMLEDLIGQCLIMLDLIYSGR